MISAAHCTDVFENNKTQEINCLKQTTKGRTYRNEDIQVLTRRTDILITNNHLRKMY